MKFLWMRTLSAFILCLLGTSTTFLVFQNCAPAQFGTTQLSSQSTSSTSCDPNHYTPQPYTNADFVGTCSCSQTGVITCQPTGCADPSATFRNGLCTGPSVSSLSVLINGLTSTSLVPSTSSVPVSITASGPIHSLVTGTGIAKIGGACSVASIDPSQLSIPGGQFSLGTQGMIYDTSLASAMAGCVWRITGVADNGRSAYADFTALLCAAGTSDPSHPTCTTSDGRSGHTVCATNGLSYDCVPNSSQNCTFNGQTIANGSSVTAYPSNIVSYGQSCVGQTRVCQNGVLSGTAGYSTCSTTPGASCSFNGQTVADGASVTGYAAPNVPAGSSCSSGPMTCHNGNLVGSDPYATCSVLGDPNCPYNGQTLNNGQNTTLFQNSSVPFGSTCVSENLLCNNGTITGGTAPYYQFGSCSVQPPANCNFNGTPVANGSGVTAWQDAAVPYGQTCQSQYRTCTNGSLSGSFTQSGCTVNPGAACSYNGQSIANGASVSGFAATSVAYGQSCQPVSVTCNNGNLSGSVYPSCNPQAPVGCSFNGQAIANGASVTAWNTGVAAYGSQCVSQTRTCSNGTLSGSYGYASCSTTPGQSCLFNGQTIASGSSASGYTSASVPFGQNCQAATTTCTNGSLAPSVSPTCSTQPPASCTFNGVSVAHGSSVTGYTSTSVPYGQNCNGGTRTCNNGSLSGDASYQYSSCQTSGPASCVFQGQTYADGQSLTAFFAGSVPYGQSCASETRVCQNGNFSGSAAYPACAPSAPASCSFNGQAIAHGQSVTAYNQSSGASCPSETATCDNGSLGFDAGYTYASCTVVAQAPSAFVLSKCGRKSDGGAVCGIGDPLVDGTAYTTHVCQGQPLQDWYDNGPGAPPTPNWSSLPTVTSAPAGTQCMIFIKMGYATGAFTDVIFFSGPPQPDALTTGWFGANGASVTSVSVPGLTAAPASAPAAPAAPTTSTSTGTSSGSAQGSCLRAVRGGQKLMTTGSASACD